VCDLAKINNRTNNVNIINSRTERLRPVIYLLSMIGSGTLSLSCTCLGLIEVDPSMFRLCSL
jgi:hypothetical protein